MRIKLLFPAWAVSLEYASEINVKPVMSTLPGGCLVFRTTDWDLFNPSGMNSSS